MTCETLLMTVLIITYLVIQNVLGEHVCIIIVTSFVIIKGALLIHVNYRLIIIVRMVIKAVQ